MLQPPRLTVAPEVAQVALGDRLTLALTVRNTGSGEARYRLEVGGIPADWCDLDQRHLSLLPAASAQVLLTVHPPAGPAAMAGRYTLTVQATAEEDPALQAAATVALTVKTGGGLDMDVQPAEAVGRKGVFRVTFLNQMTWPVEVALTARDHADGLRFHIEPETPLVVPATGVAGPLTVRVVPRVRAWRGAPQAYEIRFCGLDLGSAEASRPSLVRWARFVYVPRSGAARLPRGLRRVPGWALLLPLLLLLLLLGVLGSRTLAPPAPRPAATPPAGPAQADSSGPPPRPRAVVQGVTRSGPSIRRFSLVHRRAGQPYALVWQTQGAARVTLAGRPVAPRGRLVLPPPLHSATYRLVARSGARQATARLHVVVDARPTDPHAVVLTTPRIAAFAVRRHRGGLYATWRVRQAVQVWLHGRAVAPAGAARVPRGTSWLRLVAQNDVGRRQQLLPLAPLASPTPPPATATATRTPTPRPTLTPTALPTGTPPPLPTPPPTARPTATFAPPPTSTPALRPATLPTSPPTATPTPPPTTTSTPRPTVTSTPIPTLTSTPIPTVAPTARPIPTLPAAPILSTPTAVPTPGPIEAPTSTAVPITCCAAQP